MTQREAKEALGVKEGTVPRLLYGDRLPGLALANKLELSFGIPTADWGRPAREPFQIPERLGTFEEPTSDVLEGKPATA
jgi:transcriptional regulator with XRE-family HTH domain